MHVEVPAPEWARSAGLYWPHDSRHDNPEIERPAHYRGPSPHCDARRAGIDAPAPERRQTGGSRCAVQMWSLVNQTVLW